MFMMSHNDGNHTKKSAFPPHVTLYDETIKVQFDCGYLETSLEIGDHLKPVLPLLIF